MEPRAGGVEETAWSGSPSRLRRREGATVRYTSSLTWRSQPASSSWRSGKFCPSGDPPRSSRPLRPSQQALAGARRSERQESSRPPTSSNGRGIRGRRASGRTSPPKITPIRAAGNSRPRLASGRPESLGDRPRARGRGRRGIGSVRSWSGPRQWAATQAAPMAAKPAVRERAGAARESPPVSRK